MQLCPERLETDWNYRKIAHLLESALQKLDKIGEIENEYNERTRNTACLVFSQAACFSPFLFQLYR